MIDAHDHHTTPHASGTSPHQHHRGWIQHDGVRVGYSTCRLGTASTHHCPDEPDPWVRWAEKVMARQATTPRAPGPKVVCDRHPESRWRTYTVRAGPLCLDCRAEKRRIERIGRRIAREASRAA